MTKKSPTAEELARAGVFVETPSIEIQDEQPAVEPIGMDGDFKRVAAEEAFMNEFVVIRIATTTNPNDPPFATVTVNDVVNRVQIPRGVPTRVKRSQLEVLARMRETRYEQQQLNPMAPPEAGIELRARHAQVYPVEVLKDTEQGKAWYERLVAEPTY